MAVLPGHIQYFPVFAGYFRFFYFYNFMVSSDAKISAVRNLADICFLHVLIRLIRYHSVSFCLGI